MYSIAFRHDPNLVDIRWTGLLEAASVDAYAGKQQRPFHEKGFRPGYRLRTGRSGCTVQPVAAAAGSNDWPAGMKMVVAA